MHCLVLQRLFVERRGELDLRDAAEEVGDAHAVERAVEEIGAHARV